MKDVLCGGCGHPKNTHFKTGACAHGYQDWIKMAKESQLNGKEVDDDWCDCKDFVKKETVKCPKGHSDTYFHENILMCDVCEDGYEVEIVEKEMT